MTTKELHNYLNTTYGLSPWPKELKVNAETYSHCCNDLIHYMSTKQETMDYVILALGSNQGILFKDVELILDKEMK